MSTATADASTTAQDLTADENRLIQAYRYIRRNKWITLTLAPIAIAILFLLLWQAMTGEGLNSFEQRALAPEQIRRQVTDHISMTAISTALVMLFAIPLGIFLTRPSARRITDTVVGVASGGQAVPAYGLLVLFFLFFGSGFSTAVYALTLYSILPVLRNTMAGLKAVDQGVIEAARGMGLSKAQVLRQIEIPLAVPIMLAGVRTALIINVGTAALATFIGAGGLGEVITIGLELRQDFILFSGAALTALLALTVDWMAAVVEYLLSPKGLR